MIWLYIRWIDAIHWKQWRDYQYDIEAKLSRAIKQSNLIQTPSFNLFSVSTGNELHNLPLYVLFTLKCEILDRKQLPWQTFFDADMFVLKLRDPPPKKKKGNK